MNTFEELKCWQLAKELRKKIRVVVRSFPTEEKYKLIDQLTRSSRSVKTNIAEGYGRYHYLDNAKFCRMSRGSLYEVLDHLIEARSEEHTSELQSQR